MRRAGCAAVLLLCGCDPDLAPDEAPLRALSELTNVSGEFPSGPAITTGAFFTQTHPHVASGPSGTLAVWDDVRYGPAAFISGTRLDPKLGVIDPNGLRITLGNRNERAPAVGAALGHFYVVWEGRGAGGSTDIFGTRVLPDGRVEVPIPIATGPSDELGAAVECDVDCLVTWSTASGGIYAQRVLADGALNTATLVLSMETTVSPPSVASYHPGGSATLPVGYVVAWSQGPTAFAATVDPNNVAEIRMVSSCSAPGPLAVAVNGLDALVVHPNCSLGGLSANYLPLDGGGARADLSIPGVSAAGQSAPAVAAEGTGFRLLWKDDGQSDQLGHANLKGSMVTPGPVISGGDMVTVRGPPSLALGPGDAGVIGVWDRSTAEGGDVYGVLLSSTSPAEVLISTAANAQQRPQVATDEKQYLLVWADTRGLKQAGPRIYGSRFLPDETSSLDGPGFLVSEDTRSLNPVVAYNRDAGQFLVAWEDATFFNSFRVRAKRVSPDGTQEPLSATFLGPDARPSAYQPRPRVASNGATWLLVWGNELADGGTSIVTNELTVAGPASPLFSLVKSPGTVGRPAVAAAVSGRYYVAWDNGVDGGTELWGSFVPPDNASPQRISATGRAAGLAGAPNGDVVAVWYEPTTPTGQIYQLRATRISPSGAADAGRVTLASDAALLGPPMVVVEGNHTGIAWSTASGALRGAVVDSTGNITESIALTDGGGGAAGLAVIGDAHGLLAYERVDPDVSGARRVFLRWLSWSDGGTTPPKHDGGTDAGAGRDGGTPSSGNLSFKTLTCACSGDPLQLGLAFLALAWAVRRGSRRHKPGSGPVG